MKKETAFSTYFSLKTSLKTDANLQNKSVDKYYPKPKSLSTGIT